jgi:outer membrane receptor protein involved in Fe transport
MGSSRITLLLAVGTTLLAANTDLADKPKAKAEAGATVTVTAEAVDVAVTSTPNPVKVLGAGEIQTSGAQDLAEVLPLLLPGQLQTYGGPGTGTNLYLGGGRSQDVVVLLDGIRITDPSSSHPSFSDFSLEGIDRVEVLQGPASTRYGADTHGGAIALYSAGPGREGLSGSTSLGAGNRGLRKVTFAPAYAWSEGWLRLGLSADQEEQSIPAKEPYRTTTGSLNMGRAVGESGLLTLTYRNHYRATPLPFAGDYLPPTWTYTPVFDPTRQSTERDEAFIWRRTAWSQACCSGPPMIVIVASGTRPWGP